MKEFVENLFVDLNKLIQKISNAFYLLVICMMVSYSLKYNYI